MAFRIASCVRYLVPLALLAAVGCSSDDTPPPTVVTPALTALTVTLPGTSTAMGQTVTATVTGQDQQGTAIATGEVTWSTSSPDLASVTAAGVVRAISPGTVQIIASAGGIVGTQALTIVGPAPITINEVESNGGTPGDWIELFNPTAAAVDLTGWVVKDNDDTHSYALPAGSTIAAGGYLVVEEAGFGFGLGAPDAARLYSPYGVAVDAYSWTAHAALTYGRCSNGTGPFLATTTSTKGAANDCSVNVKINEVESSGGTPGDWIELYNAGPVTANLSGYIVRDDDDTHNFALPAGTTLAAGAYLVVEEASLGFGLGAPDAARLFTPAGTLMDSYSWTAHATTTYGRCADGTGTFATTVAPTKGAVNSCTPVGPVTFPWPGSNTVDVVDGLSVFGSNLSGLAYEGATGGSPSVLWAVRNGPGTLYRLIFNGTIWTPDAANGWGAGKALHYLDGLGNTDAEGVTFAGTGSAGGIYVSTERNNDASTISRNSILRFDASGSATSLNATNDWNITADLPVVGANLGIEDITYIPDAYLTSQGFFDELAGHAYVPSEYPDHGTGLFFVGLEANGSIYAYALNHTNNTFKRVATILSGFPGVMGLSFDRELNYLWAVCDDGCNGRMSLLEIDTGAGSATKGRFVINRQFDRPTGMVVNLNNEGFTFAPQSECVAGFKAAFWSDDGETGGHSIRRASIPCTRFP